VAIITITRGSLSATCKLAQKLNERTGCRILSREEVLEHGVKFGIKETGLGEAGLMEKHPPSIWDRHAAQRRYYLIIFKAALMDLIAGGNIVYHGHVGQFLLTDIPKILRIRADASLQFRVNTLMVEMGMSEAEAEEHIRDIDLKRRNWAKFLYGIDFNDSQNYDLILNMNKMSLDTMADVIVCATQKPEFSIDQEVLKQIKDVHMKALIFASLVRSPRTRGMDLKVECDSDSGRVIIRGAAPVYGADIWRNDINDVLSKMDNVKNVEIIL
jgi:hypothetical protein